MAPVVSNAMAKCTHTGRQFGMSSITFNSSSLKTAFLTGFCPTVFGGHFYVLMPSPYQVFDTCTPGNHINYMLADQFGLAQRNDMTLVISEATSRAALYNWPAFRGSN